MLFYLFYRWGNRSSKRGKKFTQIHIANKWTSQDSISGPYSYKILAFNQSIILPKLLTRAHAVLNDPTLAYSPAWPVPLLHLAIADTAYPFSPFSLLITSIFFRTAICSAKNFFSWPPLKLRLPFTQFWWKRCKWKSLDGVSGKVL